MTLRAVLIWLVLIAGMFACVAAFKSNGATDHPLLVDASCHPEPPLLFAPCPLTPRNLPLREEREA